MCGAWLCCNVCALQHNRHHHPQPPPPPPPPRSTGAAEATMEAGGQEDNPLRTGAVAPCLADAPQQEFSAKGET